MRGGEDIQASADTTSVITDGARIYFDCVLCANTPGAAYIDAAAIAITRRAYLIGRRRERQDDIKTSTPKVIHKRTETNTR